MQTTRRLEPRTLGDIVDRAADIYRRHFWLFTGILFACSLPPWLAGQAIAARARASAADAGLATLATLLLILPAVIVIEVFFYRFAEAVITLAVSNSYLGREIRLRETLSQSLRRLPVLLAAVALTLGIALGAGAAATVPFVIAAALARGASPVIIGFIIAAAVVFSLGTCLAAALPFFLVSEAVMLERLGPVKALIRSFELIVRRSPRGLFNPANHSVRLSVLLLLILALNLMAAAVSRIPVAVYGVIAAVRQGGGLSAFADAFQTAHAASALMGLLASALVQPLGIAALVLFYYDLRVRTEGFDLEILARELGGAGHSQAEGR